MRQQQPTSQLVRQQRVKRYVPDRRGRRDAFIGRKTTLGIGGDNEGVAKCRGNDRRQEKRRERREIQSPVHTREYTRAHTRARRAVTRTGRTYDRHQVLS